MIPNYDSEIEKMYHPENFSNEVELEEEEIPAELENERWVENL